MSYNIRSGPEQHSLLEKIWQKSSVSKFILFAEEAEEHWRRNKAKKKMSSSSGP